MKTAMILVRNVNNATLITKNVYGGIFWRKKPVERPKVSGLSEISDTGHSWAADRRPADHFGLWLRALR
jgi:hypothetical protein